MIDRDTILGKLEAYDPEKIKIGVLASHSALDVCDGAVEEGFRLDVTRLRRFEMSPN